MRNVRRPPVATGSDGHDAGSRTSVRDRRRSGSRVVKPTVTEPDVVPMTVEQHDQAVAALATMICDWLQTRAATGTAEAPEALNPPQHHHEREQ